MTFFNEIRCLDKQAEWLWLQMFGTTYSDLDLVTVTSSNSNCCVILGKKWAFSFVFWLLRLMLTSSLFLFFFFFWTEWSKQTVLGPSTRFSIWTLHLADSQGSQWPSGGPVGSKQTRAVQTTQPDLCYLTWVRSSSHTAKVSFGF